MEPVADKNNGQTKRTRGVQASKAKLSAAQLAAGIKSQAELAKRIQQLEGLSNPPRSLVNRVFSGEQVDLLSLERVAKALNTEAWSLYLTSTDTPNATAQTTAVDFSAEQSIVELPAAPVANSLQTDPFMQPESALVKKPARLWLLLPLLILLGLWLHGLSDSSSAAATTEPVSPAVLSLERKVLTVLPFEGDQSRPLTAALEQALASFGPSLSGSAARFAQANPIQLLTDKQVDLVFSGEARQFERHLAIRLFVYQRQGMQQIWAGTIATSSSSQWLQHIFEYALQQARQGLHLVPNPNWDLVIRYTKALNYFELDRTEQNLLKLVDELNAVLRLDETYADAQAGLCSALIQQSILTGSTDKLQEAQQSCDRAAKLDPNAISVLQAKANLARKQGEIEQASELLQHILQRDPHNVTAQFVMAEVKLLLFRKTGEANAIDEAIRLLQQAIQIEPQNWKLPYTLGRAYYFGGKVNEAIDWSERAAKLRPEYQTFNNLGTLQFCKGDLSAAKQHYQAALSYQPADDIVLGNIATLHYYLEEYPQAIDIFEQRIQVLEQQGSDQQYNIWMNLGNAYRHNGQVKAAVQTYHKALQAIEHAIAKGEANHLQRAIRVAIYLDLVLLQPEFVSVQLQDSLRQEAQALDAAAEPASLHMMALIWMYLGDMEKAAALKQRLAGNCPGFVASPDFAPLERHLKNNSGQLAL